MRTMKCELMPALIDGYVSQYSLYQFNSIINSIPKIRLPVHARVLTNSVRVYTSLRSLLSVHLTGGAASFCGGAGGQRSHKSVLLRAF